MKKWYVEIFDEEVPVYDSNTSEPTGEKKHRKYIIQFYRGSEKRKSKKENIYHVEIENPPKDFKHQSWYEVDFTDTEKTSLTWKVNTDKWLNKKVRPERNELLKQTDWTQLPDNGMDDIKKQEWKAYRQKLRDFPDTIEYGNEQWPEEPK